MKTKGVRLERTRDFGDVYLSLCLWRMLGLDDFFERELPEGREEIPWHLTACALAVARFCEPSSELHVEDTCQVRSEHSWNLTFGHERFVLRIRKGLVSIQKGLRRAKKPRDKGKIERRIGGLLAKNSRAAKAFEIELLEDPERPAGVRLRYRGVKKWRDWAALSQGSYLLRTNLSGKSPEELWRTYIQLTDVEDVFRTEKTELAIRPIWHQLEARVQAHVLFSFLAYAMWKTLQTWMDGSGLGRGARTVIEEFVRIKVADVVLPTTAGRDLKLMCVTRPDKTQAAIIERLGLELPERLGRPRWVRGPLPPGLECSLDFSRRRPQIGR